MGECDIHILIDERFEGQHIMSDFAKTGILNEVWAENEEDIEQRLYGCW